MDEEQRSLEVAADLAGMHLAEIVAPSDQVVAVRGMRLHYLDWGTPGQRPILFLPGGGLTAHTFDLVCLALRQEYHCLALDPRGHGDSDWSAELDYGLDADAADVAAFAEIVGLREMALVGMSMGGSTAIHYAAAHRDRVAALVVIDVGPEIQLAGVRRIGSQLADAPELDSVEAYVAKAKAMNPRRDERLLRRSLRHNLRQTPRGTWTWKYDPRIPWQVDPADRAKRGQVLWSDVGVITCPVLVLRGAESDVFSDSDAKRLAARLAHGRWARIPNAGHSVHGDNPAAVSVAIRSFLTDAAPA